MILACRLALLRSLIFLFIAAEDQEEEEEEEAQPEAERGGGLGLPTWATGSESRRGEDTVLAFFFRSPESADS
jgi:hypothetical protein